MIFVFAFALVALAIYIDIKRFFDGIDESIRVIQEDFAAMPAPEKRRR